jgi:hypothetical protein
MVEIGGGEFAPPEEPVVEIAGFEFSAKGDPMVGIDGFEPRSAVRSFKCLATAPRSTPSSLAIRLFDHPLLCNVTIVLTISASRLFAI